MKLILAEKPSVAKNIADALGIKTKRDGYFEGSGYLITWAFGHLVELYDAKDYDSRMTRWKMDNFPFIPENFQYKVKSSSRDRSQTDGGAAKQLKTVHSLMKRADVEVVISACDYDREGQLIGDSIIYRGGKPKKQVYRLLLNEWTKKEVIRGLENLHPNDSMKNLRDAGISRQWADWVIGINLTSVATLKYQSGKGKALNIGRVLLPTLKIIYDRDKEIAEFQPESYFKLTADFETDKGAAYQGIYREGKEEKFKDQEKLQKVQEAVRQQKGIVQDKQVERKKEFPPFLFNLSNLQGYITNRYNGWTSDKVLKAAQSLYEKKLITYPRTSSTALEESLVGKTAHVLKTHAEDSPFKDEINFVKSRRIFNNAKVESHSAIIPTYLKPKHLRGEERIVYQAILHRFVAQFMPVAEYEETRLQTKVETAAGVFVTKGRVQLVEGWKKVENIQSKESILPSVERNEMAAVTGNEISSHVTKPPKNHTERTLLKVMETCGKNYKGEEDDEQEVGAILAGFSIGTAATRAETIKKLKDVGYIEAKGKSLSCTALGVKMVETFPVKDLFDLEFTGRLEKELSDIQKGNADKRKFLRTIFQFIRESVAVIKEGEEVIIRQLDSKPTAKEVLGICPECGGEVKEGFKGFGCEGYGKKCQFMVWKNDKYLAAMRKRPTKTMVKSLLKNERAHVKGLTSKKGKKFSAYLSYKKNREKGYYSWEMEFKNKK
ncbi:DNA topoisomerase [Virgibacillus xinjiangensis]|uniref:DNA topoisomerase n=1 Tax=Virgibacillus xinjiangensis TaxID=393090 RepID=A0ABV7CUI6_9BACI